MITIIDRILPHLDPDEYAEIENDLVLCSGLVVTDQLLFKLVKQYKINNYEDLAQEVFDVLDTEPFEPKTEEFGPGEERIEKIREINDKLKTEPTKKLKQICDNTGWDIIEYNGYDKPIVIEHADHGRFRIKEGRTVIDKLQRSPDWCPQKRFKEEV